jgi:uncharacterized radical SAM protein YgiQ
MFNPLPILNESPASAVTGAGEAPPQAGLDYFNISRPGMPLALAATQPLPMTRAEMEARGWDEVDVVFVTGDAYVDHPSFAMALIGRLLESEGLRVAILSQPNWQSADPWREFGRPRLFFGISAGNMDSMINHYTANRKVRNDDAYSPGGQIGRRPDRATLAYCQRSREAFKGVPIIAGGVEASLRRIAHYDYWSDKVRRPIIMDCKADLLVFGMGERPILEIAQRLRDGKTVRDCRDIRGVCYRLGAKEAAGFKGDRIAGGQEDRKAEQEPSQPSADDLQPPTILDTDPRSPNTPVTAFLPPVEEAQADKLAFCRMTRIAHHETNPYNAKRLIQFDGAEAVVVNPPAYPLTQPEMDRVYALPFTRRPHPSYGDQKIPAWDVIRTSVQIMRGCFGGCTFCSITAHEGPDHSKPLARSVIAEIRKMTSEPDFTGVISDIGGPTAKHVRDALHEARGRSQVPPPQLRPPDDLQTPRHRSWPACAAHERSPRRAGVRKVLIASGDPHGPRPPRSGIHE